MNQLLKKNYLLGAVLLLLGYLEARAQVPTAEKARQWYDKETIYLISPTRYVRNNTVYVGAASLQREFSISPGGLQLYLRSRRKRNIATVISLGGAAGSIAALVSGNRSTIRTFFWVSLGTGLVSSTLSLQASSQLNQAVWLRNRDALLFLDNPE
ncbi:hypothetical protein GCM10027275_09190 [Rhabdobacter roseus]